MAFISDDGTGTTLNITAANTSTLWYRLMKLIETAGWVHQASSNGTSVTNTPGNGNNIITSATEMNKNNAWYVYAQPAIARGIGYPGNRQIIVRRGASDTTWLLAYVPANTDGTKQAQTAAGTTTAIPTYATTQIQVGTLPDTTTSWSGHTSRHSSMAADNAAPYGFYFVNWQDGGGPVDTGTSILFDFVEPGTYDPLDIDPCVIYATTSFSLTQSSNSSCLGNVQDAAAHGPRTYHRRGYSDETYTTCALAAYAVNDGSTLVVAVPAAIGRGLYTPAREIPLPAYYMTGGQNGGTPAGAVNGQVCAVKGKSYMLTWRMGGYPIGTLITHRTPGDRCVYGDVTLPHPDNSIIPTVTA